ncbi:MAG TPA: wax ester/triacylglycerol synthase domain-containing protein [Candidatus Binatia bacterium]|nr:wax ester/triacylglycerol synthase domain-containing protein [Candidatus Binatia bacterium]
MSEPGASLPSEPLSGEDLGFWWGDQPRQRTCMAMLLLLDRRPHSSRLRAAVARAVEAVPRLRQRVVDSPLGLAKPRWEDDPTFDLDFHVRRYAVSHDDGSPQHSDLKDLFQTIGPIYERPFDRTRPLWELIELDGPGAGAAVFFRLHHCVADGVGGNAILAALTDGFRDDAPPPVEAAPTPGAWTEPSVGARLAAAIGHRIEESAARARALAGLGWTALTEPSSWLRGARIVRAFADELAQEADSPLADFGRARHLRGFDVPFEPLRQAKAALGGQMIDLLLAAAAGAMGTWHREHGHESATDVVTLVPINLRSRAEQGIAAATGNRATGVIVKLPLGMLDPTARFDEVHARMTERKASPALDYLPVLAEALAIVPAPVVRALSLLGSQTVQLIVTNVPGIMQPRYLAGARITAGYPFAPLASRCPVSIALYGYDGRLFIGVDADGTAMPDVDHFADLLRRSFGELIGAALVGGERRAS